MRPTGPSTSCTVGVSVSTTATWSCCAGARKSRFVVAWRSSSWASCVKDSPVFMVPFLSCAVTDQVGLSPLLRHGGQWGVECPPDHGGRAGLRVAGGLAAHPALEAAGRGALA